MVREFCLHDDGDSDGVVGNACLFGVIPAELHRPTDTAKEPASGLFACFFVVAETDAGKTTCGSMNIKGL